MVLVIGWAAIRGWEEGAIAGAIGGLFLDCMSATPFGVNVFRLVVLGIVAGLVMERLARTGAALPLAAGAVSCVLAFMLNVIALQAAGWTVAWERAALVTALPSAVLTLLCMAALLPVFHAVERRLGGDDIGLARDG